MKIKTTHKSYKVLVISTILLVSLAIVYIAYMSLPWLMMVGYSLFCDENSPQSDYGEFEIELSYKTNGEIVTTEATYVAKYKGTVPTTGRKWSGYIKETGESGIVVYSENNTKITVILGSASYFMGDIYFENPSVPHIIKEEKSFLKTNRTALSQQELYEQYSIEIVDWKIADPIVNSFN